MRYSPMNRSKGFTIVELLIVIVVIGILAAVSIVAYNGITNSARDAAVLSDAESVAGEVTRYSVKNDGQYGEAVEWYSGGSANANINFTPSPGNIIDIVANEDDYCIRVYNPSSKQYSSLEAAATKGSSDSACGVLVASAEATEAADPYTYADVTWVQRTSAGLRAWSGAASSADGSKLAATVDGGYIYTSTDSGATWTERTSAGSRAWHAIASSSDGSKLAATVDGGYIYTSTDSGATWTERTSAGSRQWWGKIASSHDGTHLVASPSWGYPYTSEDSGATWTARSGTGYNNWRGFAISSEGDRIIGVAMSNPVWVSPDTGATWSSQTIGTVQWSVVTSSADGTKLVIGPTGNQGPLHVSTDSGATWGAIPDTTDCWQAITGSASGTKLAASSGLCGDGYISLSTDQGVTWDQDTSMGRAHWIDIASSTNGARFVIVSNERYVSGSFVDDGYIYTGEYN